MSSSSPSSDEPLYTYSLLTLFLIGPPTFLSLQFIQAPYGRHHRSGWGPSLPPWLAWFLMESPTVFFSLLIYPHGGSATSLPSLSLLATFLLHYLHRTFIYPLRLHRSSTTTTTTTVPVSVATMAFVFNLLNAYVQSRSISHYSDYSSDRWFWFRFCGGLVVFIAGMTVNVNADLVLVGLKAQGGGYKIPRGGLFEVVSCPNYFGEIVEWFGWALMTWSWAGFAFFLYTCCNLLPRGCAHHRWYLDKFGEDYPGNRKAVIPFLY